MLATVLSLPAMHDVFGPGEVKNLLSLNRTAQANVYTMDWQHKMQASILETRSPQTYLLQAKLDQIVKLPEAERDRALVDLIQTLKTQPGLVKALRTLLDDLFYRKKLVQSLNSLKLLLSLMPTIDTEAAPGAKFLQCFIDNADCFKTMIYNRETYEGFKLHFPDCAALAEHTMLGIAAMEEAYFKAMAITAEELQLLIARVPENEARFRTLWSEPVVVAPQAVRSNAARVRTAFVPTLGLAPQAAPTARTVTIAHAA